MFGCGLIGVALEPESRGDRGDAKDTADEEERVATFGVD